MSGRVPDGIKLRVESADAAHWCDNAKSGSPHGPISGYGVGYADAMRKFKERQRQLSMVGKWRAVSASWTRDHGDFIDLDWTIIDY